MSLVTKFLETITEPQFKLARDLVAMAIADGEVTPEEKKALSAICRLEGVDEAKLMEELRSGYNSADVKMPSTQEEKELYLKDIIRLIGADGYAAPQEIYLFQIIACKMGLNQMDVIGVFMLGTSRRIFQGDAGSKIFASFLRNYIDPKAKSDKANRENLRVIYETVASHTEVDQDKNVDPETLRQNLARATEIFLENKILIKEFAHMGMDFSAIVKQEEMNVFKRYA